VVVENATIPGYTLPSNTSTSATVSPGEQVVLVIYNASTAPAPPPEVLVIPPEPAALAAETATPTPSPSPTPTPVETEEFVIEDVAPAFGPETGEGDILFILMGVLLLAGSTLFVLRKKVILNK
jgi:LPXTG-motif cell wall-anchored protein